MAAPTPCSGPTTGRRHGSCDPPACAFTSPAWSAVIGGPAGVPVIYAAEFIERVLKVDDPVGAIAVHGVCGTFGVLAVGIFANGSYGGGWNGSDVTVEGVVAGKVGQLRAQALGAAVLWTAILGVAPSSRSRTRS